MKGLNDFKYIQIIYWFDKVDNPIVPNWCSHWTNCYEESGNFNWEDEFNF